MDATEDPFSMFSVLDVFSGVGAYSLGLERTGGFKTVAFCEIEEYPRGRLRKHWPNVSIYDDVRTLTRSRLLADGIVPNWIVGGWPCQGNSPAGTGLGMDDPRSGLWSEIVRLAGELRPIGLLLENSSNLLSINDGRDFGRVLGDLASIGYDAEWHCLPAAAFDAPHIRDRVWIIAIRADTHGPGMAGCRTSRRIYEEIAKLGVLGAFAHAYGERELQSQGNQRQKRRRPSNGTSGQWPVAYAHSIAPVGTAIARQERHAWEPEPDVVRVVHGSPNRVDRIRCLGNLNPPIIPEMIGRAILAAYPRLQTERP